MGLRVRLRLSAVGIKALKEPGYHSDGDGLYLQISATGSKSWIYRYMLNKRAREMGLGSLSTFTLAEARERARKCRQLLADGTDPIEHRNAEREKIALASAERRTFEECAREYHKLHANGWKNAKYAAHWISGLATEVFPAFGKKDVSDIAKSDILQVLEPIWKKKPETAVRLRQRIRAILDWASARDYRRGHDPYLWDQVTRSLPKTKDIKTANHYAACPYTSVHDAIQS
jgi:hypothetical protein